MGKRGKRRASIPSPARFSAEITPWKDGDTTKANPFFILVVNNISLESPLDSGNLVADFSTDSTANKTLFNKAAEYIKQNLFGELPNQAEKLLAASSHFQSIRFWSIYLSGMPVNASTSLVAVHKLDSANIIKPKQSVVRSMLIRLGIDPDIVFVVSKSSLGASSIATTDDDSRGGHKATYDGHTIVHRFFHVNPGMTAISVDHAVACEMTPAHEFSHAFSSFSNGHVMDLYNDSFPPEPWQVPGHFPLNKKKERPIPDSFCTYTTTNQIHSFMSDKIRPPRGYPGRWKSYHSELANTQEPALMDNYHFPNSSDPMICVHDKLTKSYILDRIAAKVSR